MTDTTDDLVTVDSFGVLPEAEAGKLHLEAAGIRAVLAESDAVDMDWLAGNSFWNIKLQVARGDAERAAVLLSELRTRWRESAKTPKGSDSLVCLACGAAMSEEASKCSACGWSYASSESDQAS